MSEERWLPVVGFEGLYEVSNLGRVRSLDRVLTAPRGGDYVRPGRMLKLLKSTHVPSRYNVELHNSGGRWHQVHRLVLIAFEGLSPGMEVCHNDGNPSNNRLANLRWDTTAGNAADRRKHGTSIFGERHHNAKWTAIDVERMFDLRRSGARITDIGRWLGISRPQVGQILAKQQRVYG